MISTQGLAALRVAATLTHALPRLRTRVRAGSATLLDVFVPEAGEEPRVHPSCPRLVNPCAFRSAVAQAHSHDRMGQRMAFLGLPAGTDPVVDIATPPGGTSRPGGLYRVPVEGRSLWAFATTLAPGVALRLGRDLVDRRNIDPELSALGIRPDPMTDVTIAYAETTAAPDSTAEAEVIDVLEALLARWTTEELFRSIREGRRDPRSV